MKKIVALFKELINKFLKFVWIANINVSSHMTDDFRFFNEFLKSIKRRTIKIEKKRLYSNQCDSMTMRVKNDENMLTKVFYVFDFDVNLLFVKHFIKKRLIKDFNDDNLFMRIKQSIEILRAFAQENVYIMNKITSKFKEYALLAIITIEFLKVLFVSFAMSTIVNSNETLSDVDIDFRSEIDFQQFESQSFKKKRDLYQLWHRRSDHMKFAKLRNLHKIITLHKSIFIVEKRSESCEMCAITKMINAHSRRLVERKINILKLIFIDICESLFASRFDYEYFLKIVNNHFRRTWVISFRKRVDASKIFNKWKLKMKLEIERRLQTIRCDNVKKLKSILDSWCAFIDIVSQYIVLYNFIQNDVTKRDIKTIENQIRTMIQDAKLLMKFWFEAKKTNAYVRNRVNTNSIVDDNSTSFIEVWTNVKSSINHLRVWKCKCYSFVNTKSLFENSRKNKFVNTEKSNVFMSYDENIITQYKIWILDRRDIIKHHKIVFFEHKKWKSESLNLFTITMNVLFERRFVERSRKIVFASAAISTTSIIFAATSTTSVISVVFTFVTSSISVESAILENKSEARAEVKSMNAKKNNEFNDTSDENDEINEFIAKSIVQTRVKLTSLTKSSRMIQQFLHVIISKRKRNVIDEKKRDEHRNKIARVMMIFLFENLDTLDNEKWTLIATTKNTNRRFVEKLIISVFESYQNAIDDFVWNKFWFEIIQIELTTLIINEIWNVVVSFKNVNIVINKWIFKIKMHVNDTLNKLKIKLVARNFSQIYEIDYTDTFASTVKFDTLRLFFVVVILENFECHQMNVNNVFTESFLKKIIHMKFSSNVDLFFEQTLLIRRNLYELKQTIKDWHERCVKKLFKMSFEQTAIDFCMFRHKKRNITLFVYVDDVCVVVKSLEHINWFKNEFKKMFKVKNLKKMKKILDIKIIRDRKRRTIRLNQTHYLSEMLNELHINIDKHESTKISMNDYDSFKSTKSNDERINSKKYQHKIEKLMYVVIHTRSNIVFALKRLNQYFNDFAIHHDKTIKILFRYIRSIIDFDIVYDLKLNNNENFKFKIFSNFDYAIDKLNKKSIFEYVYMFVERLISWMSRKQKSIAISIIEVEYMTLSTCAKKKLWIAQFFRNLNLIKYFEIELNQMTITQNDKHEICSSMQFLKNNQIANLLIKNAHIHEKSKHIDVIYHNIRNLHQKNLI